MAALEVTITECKHWRLHPWWPLHQLHSGGRFAPLREVVLVNYDDANVCMASHRTVRYKLSLELLLLLLLQSLADARPHPYLEQTHTLTVISARDSCTS